MLIIFISIPRVNQNIVNKHNNKYVQVRLKNSIHRVHKSDWGVSYPKRHYKKLVVFVSSPGTPHFKTVLDIAISRPRYCDIIVARGQKLTWEVIFIQPKHQSKRHIQGHFGQEKGVRITAKKSQKLTRERARERD